MGRAQGRAAAQGAVATRRPTGASDSAGATTFLKKLVSDARTAVELGADSPFIADAARGGEQFARAAYTNPGVLGQARRKLRTFGLAVEGEYLPEQLTADALERSRRDYPQALMAEVARPTSATTNPLTDRAASTGRRVAVDSLSAAMPAELARRSLEAVTAAAQDPEDSHLRDLLAERGVSVEEAAQLLDENAWTSIIERWDRRQYNSEDSSSKVFRGDIVSRLRAALSARTAAAA